MKDYQELWNKTLDKLSHNLDDFTFKQTFGDVKHVLREENGIIYVLTPSIYVKSKINNVYIRQITNILESLTNQKLKFKFVCDDEVKKEKPAPFPIISKNNLNQNYTFESLVIGDANRLGYLTAMKVAENPGTFVNPLYIFGGVGLGKTHLMQAIGNYISESNLNNRILYVQANEYIDDYRKASINNNFKVFEEKYENLDCLLVDDIQMLATGKLSQESFFKLFNDMVNKNKQIVITSDCPANKLNGIMDRLTSRFSMGISVDIKQPDLNQRLNILKRKLAETSEIHVDDDILEYIAENFTDNVRELEGALNRVLVISELYNTKPTIQMAVESLEILIKSKKATVNNNYEDALSVISNMYNIALADLLGNSRNSKYVLPRHIAMYILKTKYNLTYSKIGSILNGRDHTTIMNGCKKIENDLLNDEQLKMAIESILKKV